MLKMEKLLHIIMTPRLKHLFIKDKIEFNNIKYNYNYVVYDIIGREMMRGALTMVMIR